MTDSLQANSRIYRLVGLIRGWHTPKKSMSQAFGDHPLTSQLVMFLRRAGGSFVFEDNDLERMLDAGRTLSPDALLVWLRDLTVLAITLRDDMVSPHAAKQVESSLVEPLVETLERHVEKTQRGERIRENAKAEQRAMSSGSGLSAAIEPRVVSAGASLRSRRRP